MREEVGENPAQNKGLVVVVVVEIAARVPNTKEDKRFCRRDDADRDSRTIFLVCWLIFVRYHAFTLAAFWPAFGMDLGTVYARGVSYGSVLR